MTELEKLKVREENHLPGTGADRFPVYSKQFNNLIEALADGTINLDVEDLDIDGDLTVGDDATITGDLAVTGTSAFTGDATFGAGTVASPSVVVGANDNGFYEISGTQLGVSVGNTLVGGFNSTGAFADVISEQTSTVGVTIDSALIKDGTFIGKQATATATAAGLTTGALTGSDQFVTVTSASANDVICLPGESEVSIGTVIRGWVGANGFELRNKAGDTTATINGVTGGITNEAAIPATTFFTVTHVATNTWILTAVDELGAVITAIIPDAI